MSLVESAALAALKSAEKEGSKEMLEAVLQPLQVFYVRPLLGTIEPTGKWFFNELEPPTRLTSAPADLCEQQAS